MHPSAWNRNSRKYAYPRSHTSHTTTHPQRACTLVASNIRRVRSIVVGEKTMQLLKAMREQLGDTSASRSVDAVAAANSLGMDSDTHEFARRVQDLVRAGYLEPDPNCAAPTTQGIYRITFSGIYAADSH